MNAYCNHCSLRKDFVKLRISNDSSKFLDCSFFKGIIEMDDDDKSAEYEMLSPPPVSDCLKCLKMMKEEYCSSDENSCMRCLYKVKEKHN